MLVIRLRRIGKKNKPTYRVVLAEHTWAASGKFTADLGFYNPHTKEFKVDKDTILEWLKKGAQPSNTIAKLLEGLKLKHASIVVVKKKKAAKKAKGEKAEKAAPAVAVTAEISEEGQVVAEVDTGTDAKEAEAEIETETEPTVKSAEDDKTPSEDSQTEV
ncbi:MAG TPA: 30S ribosomal protein S16 [Candidatus Saccharimonadales bacterium]|nr:30S ribosomal protein S16 [Candidatus Saccharimonadales bacterium]